MWSFTDITSQKPLFLSIRLYSSSHHHLVESIIEINQFPTHEITESFRSDEIIPSIHIKRNHPISLHQVEMVNQFPQFNQLTSAKTIHFGESVHIR
jgi:hypothetical protein